MPLIPQESQIHESAQGPRATPAASRTAPTPRPVPGPRPAAVPRPGPAVRPGPPAQRTHTPRPPAPRAAQPAAPQADAATQIQLIPAPANGALDAAGEAVDLLLDSGRAPGEVLVLTTGDQHPWAAHELSFGEASYWAQHDAKDDVFYADAKAAERAAQRPVVIVAVNDASGDDLGRMLAVARERAGTLLIVCGDPQRVNSALGAGV
ncbi:hypothetical protein GCM10010329_28490 [Streptomyces spiroverticillatus]|uniref:Uncharacterized protein n=1 Tax=Streptomyces finlayi TaxID=67296 RepID=A0A919C9N8_9ACTN|nr:hypothetical protein [Streptomyces finlayi]GHA04228.1 hypothetical protein GCM10010329_28490 [Streptomyces spiroverticillatus]GHC88304.1 hypothetical protein GCM10010334_20900 [Streptomyces finlayi]